MPVIEGQNTRGAIHYHCVKHVGALPFFAKCGIAWLLGELQRRGFKVSFQAV